jgi:hypothetical protein
MYIRTECGFILDNASYDERYYFNKKLGLCEMGNGYIMDKGTKCYNIKSQGDNLIDVLEDGDLIMGISPYGGFQHWYNVKNLHLKQDTIKMLEENNTKVITHEQYMKLAQEIK